MFHMNDVDGKKDFYKYLRQDGKVLDIEEYDVCGVNIAIKTYECDGDIYNVVIAHGEILHIFIDVE